MSRHRAAWWLSCAVIAATALPHGSCAGAAKGAPVTLRLWAGGAEVAHLRLASRTTRGARSITRPSAGRCSSPRSSPRRWTQERFVSGLGLELAPHGNEEDARSRFRFHLFCHSVLGLGGVMWVGFYGMGWRGGEWQHVLAAAGIVAIFVVAALSPHASAYTIARSALRDVRLLGTRAPTWALTTALVAVVALQPRSEAAVPTGAQFERWFASQPRIAVPVEVEDAAVLVVKFNDYQCGPCRFAHDTYKPVLERLSREYPGAIRHVTLDYPLESECNPYVRGDLHDLACEAALAVRLAERKGRGAELRDWLFSHQVGLTSGAIDKALRAIAGIDGIGTERALLDEVRRDIDTARRLGVSRTPTYFVNGVRLPVVPREDFERALRYELRLNLRTAPATAK